MEEFRPDRVVLLESGDMKVQSERPRRVITETSSPDMGEQ